MNINMLRLRPTQFKIAQSIVQTIAIYMMNLFFAVKKSAEVLFNNPSMLHYISLLASGRMKSFFNHLISVTQGPQWSLESGLTNNYSTSVTFAQKSSSRNYIGVFAHTNSRAVYIFATPSIRRFNSTWASIKAYRTYGAGKFSHVNNNYITL